MGQTLSLSLLEQLPPWQWPEDTREFLLDVLEDEESAPEDLLRAATLAGETVVIDDDLATILLDIAGDPDRPADLRARAALALGMVLESMSLEVDYEADPDGSDDVVVDPDDDEVLDLDDMLITTETYDALRKGLQELHADTAAPPEVRRAALEASARAPQDWHAVALRAAYADPDLEWRRSAVVSMISVRGFAAEILEALGDPELEHAAVVAAGNWGLEDAWEHVAALVEGPTPDRELLIAAIGALPHIDPRRAIDVLDGLEYGDDDAVIDAALAEAEAVISGELGASFDDEGEPDDDDW